MLLGEVYRQNEDGQPALEPIERAADASELRAVLQRGLMEEYDDEPSISDQPSPLTESVEATEQVQIG